jgi:hypothetical protein
MSPPVPPSPVPVRGVSRILWSQPIAVAPRGLALARENGWLLAWDEHQWLYLFNRLGHRQAQHRLPAPLTDVCAAGDSSAYAAVGSDGEVWWLAPDLMPRWERKVPHRALAVAMDPLGHYLAVADARGALYLFDRLGRTVSRGESPRSLHHLAFVPESPLLLGCADYGLLACFDLKGACVWREGLVVHIGGLGVSGDGEQIVLACYSEGLRRYSRKGRKLDHLPLAEPCSLVTLTYDGRGMLVAGLSHQLLRLDADGRPVCSYALEKPAAALALGAFGDEAFVACTGGPLLAFHLGKAGG